MALVFSFATFLAYIFLSKNDEAGVEGELPGSCGSLVAWSEEENDEEAPWLVGWLVVAIQDIQSQLLEILCTCAIFSGEAEVRDEFLSAGT